MSFRGLDEIFVAIARLSSAPGAPAVMPLRAHAAAPRELIEKKLRARGLPSSTIRQVTAVLDELEGMQMKREPRGWRDASKAFPSLHAVTRELLSPCQRPACSKSEPRRGLTCIRWSAYGVMGFSGVKDARRASYLPTLQRRRLISAACRIQSCKRTTGRLQLDYKRIAIR
jgi:hypothetical protein